MTIEMQHAHLPQRPFEPFNQDVGVCILAAGMAKRLEPISAIIAKPAFPLGGRIPIAELWVRKFAEAGLTKMAMNLHRVPESIHGYFGRGLRFLADIEYSYETEPRGTLGGVIGMLNRLKASGFKPKRVFIPSGDIVSGITIEQLTQMYRNHVEREAVFSMMLAPIPMERRGDFGTVILDGVESSQNVKPGTFAKVNYFVEKDPDSPSNENNASLYLVETDLLLQLEKHLTEASLNIENPCYDFGKHVLMGMMGKVPHLKWLEKYKDKLFGYEPGALWYDVGNKRDYLEVNTTVLKGEIPVQTPYNRFPWGCMGDNVEIDFSKVTIKAPVVIGSNCVIFPGAEIGPNVVLGDGWIVHRNAKISNSVLWPIYSFSDSQDAESIKISRIREVRENVKIDNAIIVCGIMNADIRDKTVDVGPDGALDIRSIDWVPKGPRA